MKEMKCLTRIFTFGIGSSVDRDLVEGIAKIGNGVCEVIPKNQDLNLLRMLVTRQLKRALQGVVKNIKFKLNGNVSDRILSSTFANVNEDSSNFAFFGQRLVFYCLLSQNRTRKTGNEESKEEEEECNLEGEFEVTGEGMNGEQFEVKYNLSKNNNKCKRKQ